LLRDQRKEREGRGRNRRRKRESPKQLERGKNKRKKKNEQGNRRLIKPGKRNWVFRWGNSIFYEAETTDQHRIAKEGRVQNAYTDINHR